MSFSRWLREADSLNTDPPLPDLWHKCGVKLNAVLWKEDMDKERVRGEECCGKGFGGQIGVDSS